MKIILPEIRWEDVHEYASWAGARDAALNKPVSPTLFNWNGIVAKELRACYELGYEMEKESRILYYECEFEVVSRVRTWNDLNGWGTLEGYENSAHAAIPFSYHVLLQDWIAEGDKVTVRYCYSDYKVKVVSVKTLEDIIWKTQNKSLKDA